jgi:hypothetical protein
MVDVTPLLGLSVLAFLGLVSQPRWPRFRNAGILTVVDVLGRSRFLTRLLNGGDRGDWAGCGGGTGSISSSASAGPELPAAGETWLVCAETLLLEQKYDAILRDVDGLVLGPTKAVALLLLEALLAVVDIDEQGACTF